MQTTVLCELCKETTPDNKVTKTWDNHKVCLPCYNEAAHELRKSAVTFADAVKAHQTIKEHRQAIDKYFLAVRHLAVRDGESPKSVMRTLLDAENEISELNYAKTWDTVTRGEHVTVIREVLDKVGVDAKRASPGTGDESLRDGISATRAWYLKQHSWGIKTPPPPKERAAYYGDKM